MSKTYNTTVILEKLNIIQIQTAVNPTQVQMVTGSDLKFNYKNIAGVNHLDDPAVKSFEEEDRKERLNVCSCMILVALNQLKPVGVWGAQVTGLYVTCIRTQLCAFLRTQKLLKRVITV